MNTIKLYEICCQVFGNNIIEKSIINEIRDNVNDLSLEEYYEIDKKFEKVENCYLLTFILDHNKNFGFIETSLKEIRFYHTKILEEMDKNFGDKRGIILLEKLNDYLDRCEKMRREIFEGRREKEKLRGYWRWYYSLSDEDKIKENARYASSLRPKKCVL